MSQDEETQRRREIAPKGVKAVINSDSHHEVSEWLFTSAQQDLHDLVDTIEQAKSAVVEARAEERARILALLRRPNAGDSDSEPFGRSYMNSGWWADWLEKELTE